MIKKELIKHARIFAIWTAGLLLLWVALWIKGGKTATLGFVVGQTASAQEAIYFDDEMPVFRTDEPTKDVAATPAAQTESAVQSSRTNTPAAQRTSAAPRARTAQRSGPVNINTANANQLTALPGIGPAMAQRIIEYREAHGNFERIEDIQKVRGIGPARFEAMKDMLRL